MLEEMTTFYCSIQHQDEKSTSDKVLFNHCHDNYEIIYVLKGKTNCILNNKKYLLPERSVFIIPPFQYHNIELISDIFYERIILQFKKDLIPTSILKKFHDNLQNIQTANSENILIIFQKLLLLIQQKNSEDYHVLAHCKIIELIYLLADYKEPTVSQELSMSPLTLAIIDYIDQNLYTKITLQQIAQSVLSSLSNITHTFKADMQTSIQQFDLQKKIA